MTASKIFKCQYLTKSVFLPLKQNLFYSELFSPLVFNTHTRERKGNSIHTIMSYKWVVLFNKVILTSQRSQTQNPSTVLHCWQLSIKSILKASPQFIQSTLHSTDLQSISAPTLLTTCFNSMLKSLTLFLSCFFLCPLFPPLLFSSPPLHPSHYSPSLPPAPLCLSL